MTLSDRSSTALAGPTARAARLRRGLLWLLGVLVVQKTVVVTLGYSDYFPPDFRADFLLGRRGYFFGPYGAAFYAHVVAGPFCLLAGLALLAEPLRRRFPVWHRRLGRVQVAVVLLALAPSGFWMAWYAPGPVARLGFASLAVATAWCVAAGWRAAVRRRFDSHARWMLRVFVLLGSTLVLRLAGGLAELLRVEGTYAAAAWLSWLAPLTVLEAYRLTRRRLARTTHSAARHAPRRATTS